MRRNQKIALLLSSLYTLVMLAGCGKNDEVIIKTDEGEQRVSMDTLDFSKKTFAPGEHIIYYQHNSHYTTNKTGWGVGTLDVPETPEGYTFVNAFTIDEGYQGHSSDIVYMFVNNKIVEAEATYNEKTHRIEYYTPGVVVNSLELTK